MLAVNNESIVQVVLRCNADVCRPATASFCGPVGSGVVEVEAWVPELQEQRMLKQNNK